MAPFSTRQVLSSLLSRAQSVSVCAWLSGPGGSDTGRAHSAATCGGRLGRVIRALADGVEALHAARAKAGMASSRICSGRFVDAGKGIVNLQAV